MILQLYAFAYVYLKQMCANVHAAMHISIPNFPAYLTHEHLLRGDPPAFCIGCVTVAAGPVKDNFTKSLA